MSQLLDSLKKSDDKNTDQSEREVGQGTAKVVHPMRSVKAQTVSTSWAWPLVIALLPAAAIIGYKFYQQVKHEQGQATELNAPLQQAPQSQPSASYDKQVLQAPAESSQANVLSPNKDVMFLDYPQLVTEPLPIGDSLYSAAPAYQDYEVPMATESYSANASTDNYVPVTKPVAKQSEEQDPYQLDNLDLSGLSPKLAAQLKSAIVATDGESYQDNELDRSVDEADAQPVVKASKQPQSKVIPIGLLPSSIQNQLPKMNFEQHIYSSAPAKRWVKVNGKELHEGDSIAPGVKLARIESRDVILKFDGYEISMPALSEW
ncbi:MULTISPECIES: general secretion pathway protein GspB [unclassified Photobacterium]|uniref:general secretion pathway protein GspB n=1 Tax=unclassified Photobacterium TaxID=2628852 RepID=UPI001EDCBAE2|nr:MULTISPECIES: general secretion pathway protein GspB [unclassified Photobacterium]MCG3865023.1 general secretion pathway protein GspB [Photobacterium sp. Ph6]MCG3876431.1 general secretion pathway protein GspB [Photobacterium sp. Ph5]